LKRKRRRKKQRIVINEASDTDELSCNDNSEDEEEEEHETVENDHATHTVEHGELHELRIPREESAFIEKQRKTEELIFKQRFESLIDAVFDSENFHCSSSNTEEAEEHLAPKKTTKKP
jgi:hypothetical protein